MTSHIDPYRMENHPVMFETTNHRPTVSRVRHLHRFASWNARGRRRRHRTHGLQELLTQGAFLGPWGFRPQVAPPLPARCVVLKFLRNVYGIKLWDFYGIDSDSQGKIGFMGFTWGLHGAYMGFNWFNHAKRDGTNVTNMWPTCDQHVTNMWPTSPNIHDN